MRFEGHDQSVFIKKIKERRQNEIEVTKQKRTGQERYIHPTYRTQPWFLS
jgi:hypothetical protein